MEYRIINSSKFQEFREEWERYISKYASYFYPLVDEDCLFIKDKLEKSFASHLPIDINISINGLAYPARLIDFGFKFSLTSDGNFNFEMNPIVHSFSFGSELKTAIYLGVVE